MTRLRTLIAVVAPGVLLAATGVGAGDLATAGFAGSAYGYSLMWAVVVGAFLKFVLTENIARFQIATGETILEGALKRFGPIVRVLFGVYLLGFAYVVGAALISACGVTIQSMTSRSGGASVIDDATLGRAVFGAVCSVAGLILVRLGGFALFERVMGACVALMFVTVVVTALLLIDDWGAVVSGLLVPRIPDASGEGLTWTIALMGGVGGTLTVICYSYWMRETGRTELRHLRVCQIDLAVAYVLTGLFGVAMVAIASGIEVGGSGSNLIVSLADRLREPLGERGRWVFLAGALAAVFSSLLGVWQAVPYIFADYCRVMTGRPPSEGVALTETRSYKWFMIALALVPLIPVLLGAGPIREFLGLSGEPTAFGFKQIQKWYALVGAWFIPALAFAVLLLNSRPALVHRQRNSVLVTTLLVVTIGAFGLAGVWKLL